MSTQVFHALATAALVDEVTGVHVVGFAEFADGSGRSLTFAMSTGAVEAFDGWYDTSSEAGLSVPGGVETCIMHGRHLQIELSTDAASAIGVPAVTEVTLDIEIAELDRLREGLDRLFGAAAQPPRTLDLNR